MKAPGFTACVLVSVLATAPAHAQETTVLTGSVRAGYWSSTRDLDAKSHVGVGTLWVKAEHRPADRLALLVDGWVSLRRDQQGFEDAGDIREAFADLRLGPVDLRVGRQIIAWGRADGINPTDQLTGKDIARLVPEDDERRLGTTAVRAGYFRGGFSASGFWLPEFRPGRLPLPSRPGDPAIVQKFPSWPGSQFALRLERTGGAIDWSLSHFRGVDLSPDLGPGRLTHHRIKVFGADLAANLGRFGLRAEAAYTRTQDPDGRDPAVKNPFVFVVVGVDRTLREQLNVNLQYLFRFVERVTPVGEVGSVAHQQATLSSQTQRFQHGASLRIANTWLRETLTAELAAAGYVQPWGLTLNPKVTYLASDRWKVLFGAEVFRGSRSSVFGMLRPNSAVYVDVRCSF